MENNTIPVSTYTDVMGRKHARVRRGVAVSLLITRTSRPDHWELWLGDGTGGVFWGTFRQCVAHARSMRRRELSQ